MENILKPVQSQKTFEVLAQCLQSPLTGLSGFFSTQPLKVEESILTSPFAYPRHRQQAEQWNAIPLTLLLCPSPSAAYNQQLQISDFSFKCSKCRTYITLNTHRRPFLHGKNSFKKAPVLLSVQTLAMKLHTLHSSISSEIFILYIKYIVYMYIKQLRHNCIKRYSTSRAQKARMKHQDVKYSNNTINLICPQKWLQIKTERGEDIQIWKDISQYIPKGKTPQVTR